MQAIAVNSQGVLLILHVPSVWLVVFFMTLAPPPLPADHARNLSLPADIWVEPERHPRAEAVLAYCAVADDQGQGGRRRQEVPSYIGLQHREQPCPNHRLLPVRHGRDGAGVCVCFVGLFGA